MPGDAALGGHSGLAHRVASAIAAAFAAAQRMVDRVHRLGARVRAVAHVALPAGLPDAHVDVIEVAELSDGRSALALDAAHFAAGEDDDRVLAFLRAQPADAAGAADEFPALPRVHLDVLNLQAG